MVRDAFSFLTNHTKVRKTCGISTQRTRPAGGDQLALFVSRRVVQPGVSGGGLMDSQRGPGNAVLSFGHVPTAKNSVEFHFSSAFNCSPDLASYLRRSSTVSLRPFANASSNGVWPFTLTAFTFAPLAISSSQTSDACCSE